MRKFSARVRYYTDWKELTYWFIGVLFTLFPMGLSFVLMARQSKPLTVGDDEIMMLACLILLPTLLDYVRFYRKGNALQLLLFTALILSLATFSALYGWDKATNQTDARLSSWIILGSSFVFSFIAEAILRELEKDDFDSIRVANGRRDMGAPVQRGEYSDFDNTEAGRK